MLGAHPSFNRRACGRRLTRTMMLMLMAGMTLAFCAKQLEHSVKMFLRAYAKWIDGGQNALEMNRLEAALTADLFKGCSWGG